MVKRVHFIIARTSKMEQNLSHPHTDWTNGSNQRPFYWALGRIYAVHAGDDNIVRVATIRTKKRLIKRATKKICLLPFDQCFVLKGLFHFKYLFYFFTIFLCSFKFWFYCNNFTEEFLVILKSINYGDLFHCQNLPK